MLTHQQRQRVYVAIVVLFALFAQVLRQARDTGDRIANLVGYAGCQSSDAGQSLGVHQLVFKHLGFGQVFNQQYQAAVARRQWLVNRRLVQVEPAGLAVEGQVLLVQVLVGQIDKTLEQFFPRIAQGIEARAHHPLRGDAIINPTNAAQYQQRKYQQQYKANRCPSVIQDSSRRRLSIPHP